MTENNDLLGPFERGFYFDRMLDGDAWHSLAQNCGDGIQPTQFTRVRIASRPGSRVFGVLKAVAHGGIQVLTTIPVPVRCPLEIALEGCQPAACQALYSIQKSSVFLVGIVFSSRQKPSCALGSLATIRDLGVPLESYRGSILDFETHSLSVLCRTEIPPGAWVRVESSHWILLGVVRDVVPTGTPGCLVRIHLEAAFRVDPRNANAISERQVFGSLPRLQPWTQMERESPLQGEIL